MEDIYSPKTWLDYVALLLEVMAELPRPPHSLELLAEPVEKLPERLSQLDQSLSESIEAAIRHLSRNKTWPRLTPEESICIDLRLRTALHLASWLAEFSLKDHLVRIPTEPDCSEEEAIYEWLLIKTWNAYGRQQLASTIECILHVLRNRTIP